MQKTGGEFGEWRPTSANQVHLLFTCLVFVTSLLSFCELEPGTSYMKLQKSIKTWQNLLPFVQRRIPKIFNWGEIHRYTVYINGHEQEL